MKDTHTHRGRDVGRERQTPCREPGVGLNSRTPGSCPELKADAPLLRRPYVFFFFNVYSGPAPILKLYYLLFLLLKCMSSLYICITTPYDIYILQIFSPILWAAFSTHCFHAAQKLSSLMQSHLFIFSFGVKPKKSWPRPISRRTLLAFPSRNFTVTSLDK